MQLCTYVNIKIYSFFLSSTQVRLLHGALDEISECSPGGRRVRRCNWVRFLATTEASPSRANLRPTRTADPEGSAAPPTGEFETTRPVAPGEELVAQFEPEQEEGPGSGSSRLANSLLVRAVSNIVAGQQNVLLIGLFFFLYRAGK